MASTLDFPARIASLEALLDGRRQHAVAGLRAAHEGWARHMLGVGDGELVAEVRAAVEGGVEAEVAARAAAELAAAEQWQWEIGTWASGSGEGLSSMAEVRTLQLAQAWLWSAAPGAPGADARARELVAAVENDPNRVAARHAAHVAGLTRRLDGGRR